MQRSISIVSFKNKSSEVEIGEDINRFANTNIIWLKGPAGER